MNLGDEVMADAKEKEIYHNLILTKEGIRDKYFDELVKHLIKQLKELNLPVYSELQEVLRSAGFSKVPSKSAFNEFVDDDVLRLLSPLLTFDNPDNSIYDIAGFTIFEFQIMRKWLTKDKGAQYDKLKKDLVELDAQRQELEEELTALKAKDAETITYVDFLNKLVSTQSSVRILTGEFDVGSLLDASTELMNIAVRLGDNDIIYYLGLMNVENESQTVAAYYKAVEYCLKKIKQNLE